jgi:hypothetical protein
MDIEWLINMILDNAVWMALLALLATVIQIVRALLTQTKAWDGLKMDYVSFPQGIRERKRRLGRAVMNFIIALVFGFVALL